LRPSNTLQLSLAMNLQSPSPGHWMMSSLKRLHTHPSCLSCPQVPPARSVLPVGLHIVVGIVQIQSRNCFRCFASCCCPTLTSVGQQLLQHTCCSMLQGGFVPAVYIAHSSISTWCICCCCWMRSGADPTATLQRFGERKGWLMGQRLHLVSLGQGQGLLAETMIKQAAAAGDWVCLQNCHLAASWMKRLEEKV